MKTIERIYKYLEYKQINKSEFEKICGISNGYISKMYARRADIGESIMIQILENCPDINSEWLLTGIGDMLKSNTIEIKPIDNEWLLRRFEEVVAENALLKQKVELLELSRGKSNDPPVYKIDEKIGSHLAAEPSGKEQHR